MQLCAILSPDGKQDEDNLCELPMKGQLLLRKLAEDAVTTAVGI